MPPARNDPLAGLATKSVPFLLGILIAMGAYFFVQIDNRVKSLETKYDDAQKSAGRVEYLLAKSPNLEREVHEMHAIIISTLPDIQKTGNDTHDRVIRLEERAQDLKDQLSNVQNQVHKIPGVPK
jgi:hypothetical protein